jgi:hypothetical protein
MEINVIGGCGECPFISYDHELESHECNLARHGGQYVVDVYPQHDTFPETCPLRKEGVSVSSVISFVETIPANAAIAKEEGWTHWLDKPIGQRFDRKSSLCSQVNMGVCVKRKNHAAFEDSNTSAETICYGKILAYNGTHVIASFDNRKTGKQHTVRIQRAYFENHFEGD